MTTSEIIAAVLVVAVLVALAAVVVATRRRRSGKLREAYGEEYDRTVESTGKRRQAEKDLLARQEEHEQLALRPLAPAAQQRLTQAWSEVQARFVDTPALALTEADALVTELLAERGYPVDDFDTRHRLLSVEHADVLAAYRDAHAVEVASRARTADTEAVRNAFLAFRQVFETVLGDAAADGQPGSVSPSTTEPYPSSGAAVGDRGRTRR